MPSYMKKVIIHLNADEVQRRRLVDLQSAFAEACNVLAPVVRDTRCWNRVALHHMMYKPLRARLPAMGSQMVCNAIYSVCRASRLVYQGEKSPFNVQRWGAKPLPLLRFTENSPVYFDRHTLSLRDGQLSMYTLDGRMKFQLVLAPEVESLLLMGKLHEIVLARRSDGGFQLSLVLNEPSDQVAGEQAGWPEYVVLDTSNE